MLTILRPIHMILTALLVVLQAQLWFGRGSLPDVMRLRQQLKEQKQHNQAAQLANERLGAELNDLKDGLEMVEERARAEIGMVKPNEIFVQIPP
jgi:cell division protein FtsB